MTPAMSGNKDKNPFVSIIIPTYRDWYRLKHCLQGLCNQSYSQSGFEILIINNDPGSFPPEGFIFPTNSILISEEKPGSYAARNAGLNIAKGNILGFTDSDCFPHPDWISNAVRELSGSNKATRVTGPVKIFREEKGSWLTWKFESITAFNQKYNVSQGVAVTANLFVQKNIFEQVGSFNDSLMSGGDIEWNNRATNKGISIYFADNVLVNHPARSSLNSLVLKFRRVVGGTFSRAKSSNKLAGMIVWPFLPPIRYTKVLIRDGKKPSEVIFAACMFWSLKLLMTVEIIRLFLGGKPGR